MFPCGQYSSASPLPPVRGFPALRVLPANPTSTAASAFLRNDPFRPAYSVRFRCPPRPQWISQAPWHFLLRTCRALWPRRSLRPPRPWRWPTCAFQPPRCCRPADDLLNEAEPLHFRYGPRAALPTLSPCRYLHEPKARFPVGRLIPLAGAGISPAGSIRLIL